MIPRLKTLLLVIALAFTSTAVFADPAKDGTEVYLTAMGAGDIEHGQDKPLLLHVRIFNELKAVAVGSKGKPLAALVRFEVKDAGGRDVKLAIRPLADSAQKKYGITLKEDRVALYFGAEPEALGALAPGVYTIQVFAASASSGPVTLRLKKSGPDRDDTVGLYYRLDRRYDALLVHAQNMIQKTPDDPAGHIYHGDALAGLARGREALVPYSKAYDLIKAQSKGVVSVEEPLYIQQRVDEILAKE